MGWRTLAAIGIAFSGVVVPSFDALLFNQLDVLALALFGALAQAVGSVFMRDPKGEGALNFQAWTALLSLPVLVTATPGQNSAW